MVDRSQTLAGKIEASARGAGGVYVLWNGNVSVEEVLSLDGISGVILPKRDDTLAARYPGSVGWLDQTTGEIKLPSRAARAVVSLFEVPALGFTIIKRLWANGVRRAGFFSFSRGKFALRRLWLFGAHRIVNSVVLHAFRRDLPFQIMVPETPLPSPTVQNTSTDDEEIWTEAFARIAWQDTSISRDGLPFHPAKVMIVTRSLEAGGSERQITYTAVGLKRRGIDASVVSTLTDGRASFFLPRLTEEGVSVYGVPSLLMDLTCPFEHRVPSVEQFRREVSATVKGFDIFTDEIVRYANLFAIERPSVVHAWLDWPSAAAGLAALAVGVPKVVLSGRSLSPVHFNFLRSFMRPAYRELAKSDRVVFLNNSNAGAIDYANWIGIERNRISVVPNAVDTSEHIQPDLASVRAFREQYALPEGTPVLGSIYRLIPEKRPMLWLDIAARVSAERPDLRFLIVGGGAEREAIEARAAQLGIADKLILTGERADVAIPLAVMSCFLLTSRVEGLPNVLLEAQLSGVRIVTSAVGGAPETTEGDPLAGIAVAGDEPAHYAAAVLAILNDPEKIMVAQRELPASVLRRFSRAKMIDATLDAYGLHEAQTRSTQPRANT